ncbi:T9SS type A sorting domain-containing protein [Flavivirga rizhaonensis]|uniref:T9SS type A sorting domain-containing protein n=1 Tax=Flavivirga rizhaonensis TaxID=2559571 RepID=A0A4S1E1F2_9FLAO|nr:T9SS type A sorting domain-containing protein [Flavivirga rizhaonensis]TGV04370.1 T9SS type A sorting domain-containing protein [Flavivirga rizhaonensis]
MKKKLLKLTLVALALLATEISFAQLVEITINSAGGGLPHYPNRPSPLDIRHLPEYSINDTFIYDPNAPTSAYPSANSASNTDYYFPQKDNAQNYYTINFTIPTGKALKYFDPYARATDAPVARAQGDFDITLSYDNGTLQSETQTWVGGIPDDVWDDSAAGTLLRIDLVALGFSEVMLHNATDLKFDKNDADFTEFYELRLAGRDATLSTVEVNAKKLAISPNPIQPGEALTIKNLENNKIQVYSLLGNLVHETSSNSIDYSVFKSSGMYIIKIGNATSKLIVK